MQQKSKTGGRRTNKHRLAVAASLAAGAAALTIGAGSASAYTWLAPPHGYGDGLQPRAWECSEQFPCSNTWANDLQSRNGIQGPYLPYTMLPPR
ncbi:hypothetical protein [uncultured Williamsia sp.]|uniref:hypothetical protein n=1 Tax=uncultured Williamsia sp. TaxID=259311 RepID=UPI0026390689|nr:hypothetical protein [uncultured Williamsia sp.]